MQNRDGAYGYVISSGDRMAYDRLALIITRLDADEAMDPAGSCRITMVSAQNPGYRRKRVVSERRSPSGTGVM